VLDFRTRKEQLNVAGPNRLEGSLIPAILPSIQHQTLRARWVRERAVRWPSGLTDGI
jgi:hypothetical protein